MGRGPSSKTVIPVGQRFGRLVVQTSGVEGAVRYFLCRCECGARVSVAASTLLLALKNHRAMSCKAPACKALIRKPRAGVHWRHRKPPEESGA